jgi:hypothetical protein
MDSDSELFDAYKSQHANEVERLERQVEALHAGQRVLMDENRRLWAAISCMREAHGTLWAIANTETHEVEVESAVDQMRYAEDILIGDMVVLLWKAEKDDDPTRTPKQGP